MVKNPPANAGEEDSIHELGRSPGVGNGNPLQQSCLGNHIDRGGWRPTVHGVTESDKTEHTHTTQHHIMIHMLYNDTYTIYTYI